MPSKTRITRESIVDAAFNIVREHGLEKLSTRSIAKILHTSHIPIYSHFKSMNDLVPAIIEKIMLLLGEYHSTPRTGILSLDNGIGYVLFAWEEPHLFAVINDPRYIRLRNKYGAAQFDLHVKILSQNPRMKGFSNQQLRNFQFLAWIFVHGIASMKPLMKEARQEMDEAKLIELIREGSRTLTYGFIESQKRVSRMNTEGRR
ncbi:MAG: TetR/AcrR family transcriptional regulator [Deltaproteobacteria bacterium]|nr:TetR/AcrR family transcriptional regulator [Deltaproteobacteria bacterium]